MFICSVSQKSTRRCFRRFDPAAHGYGMVAWRLRRHTIANAAIMSLDLDKRPVGSRTSVKRHFDPADPRKLTVQFDGDVAAGSRALGDCRRTLASTKSKSSRSGSVWRKRRAGRVPSGSRTAHSVTPSRSPASGSHGSEASFS